MIEILELVKYKIIGEGINIKCSIEIENSETVYFNGATEYKDDFEVNIRALIQTCFSSNKTLKQILKEESYTLYSESEFEDFL